MAYQALAARARLDQRYVSSMREMTVPARGRRSHRSSLRAAIPSLRDAGSMHVRARNTRQCGNDTFTLCGTRGPRNGGVSDPLIRRVGQAASQRGGSLTPPLVPCCDRSPTR
jgi:hypothetical protein